MRKFFLSLALCSLCLQGAATKLHSATAVQLAHFSIEPAFLHWTTGESLTAKKLTIRFNADNPAKITNITSSSPHITWEQKEIQAGIHYELSVKPNQTGNVCTGVLSFQTDAKLESHNKLVALFEISEPDTVKKSLRLNTPFVYAEGRLEDESIQIDFAFKNHSTSPVKIRTVGNGCACLGAKLDKWEYQPNEVGHGSVQFKMPILPGDHARIIRVTTDDQTQSEWVVPFFLRVPAVINIEPHNLQWFVGEEPVAKKITVHFDSAYPMNVVSATCTQDRFSLEQKMIKPLYQYEFWLKPKDTINATSGALKIETDSKIAKFTRQMAFYSIVNEPSR